MPPLAPPRVRRGTVSNSHGNDHFRTASTSTQDSKQNAATAAGSAPPPEGSAQRSCALWVHNENFSREEVLFNRHAFNEWGVEVGDLVEISIPQVDSSTALHDGETIGRNSHRPSDSSSSSSRTQSRGRFTPLGSNDNTSRKASTGGASGHFLFVVKQLPPEMTSRHPNLQISVATSVANVFGFKSGAQVHLNVKQRAQCSASHVELTFRDQYLLRSDMWRLAMSELANKALFKGQKLVFLGSIKATIKSIYVGGKKVSAGYFTPKTVPVFRSESARYVLFVQMSIEMWDFDSEGTGDILFSRVINGLLPELFKRWASNDARHLVTIVLFTRVQYDDYLSYSHDRTNLGSSSLSNPPDKSEKDYQDFYRVVVNDMPSGQWTAILDEFKKEFRTFLRDVSIPPEHFPHSPTSAEDAPEFAESTPPPIIAGCPTSAFRGNILEAIHIASSYLAFEYVGRDLVRTGTSIAVITPGTGVFEVDFNTLALTSDALTSRSIAIDLICLSPMPLHSVPLFKYKIPKPETSNAANKDTRRDPDPGMMDKWANTFKTGYLAGSLERSFHYSANTEKQAEEWGYGIPYWMDISFWDPQIAREKRLNSKSKLAPQAIGTISTQPKQFVPKVRMYEIQMMGVMESEQSNVSIPRLCIGGPNLPPLSPTLHTSSTNKRSSTYLNPHSSPHKLQGSESDRPGSFMYSFRDSKKYMMPAQVKRRTNLLEWMDDYDRGAFHSPSNRKNLRARSKSKASTEQESPKPEPHSIRANSSRSSDIYINARPSRPSHPTPQLEKTAEEAPIDRKPSKRVSTTSVKTMNTETQPKTFFPRVSRSISFALLGLGRAPPTAVASTEVKTEHAKALPTAGGKTPDDAGFDSSNTSETGSISKATSPELNSSKWDPNNVEVTPSRPISIRTAIHHIPEERSSLVTPRPIKPASTGATEVANGAGSYNDSHTAPPLKRTGRRLDMAMNSPPVDDIITSPSKALASWIKPVKPWKPPNDIPTRTSWFGRWHHVYARLPTASTVNWKGLKSPAILPLTTEEFPSEDELSSNFFQTPYRVSQNEDPDVPESPKTREVLLREMIVVRLSYGFQLVVGKKVEDYGANADVLDTASLAQDGSTIFMSMGNIIHRLVCIGGAGIEVTKYTRKPLNGYLTDPKDLELIYTPAVKTILGSRYCKNTIRLGLTQEDYNWNYADSWIAGHRDHIPDPARQLRYWRTRFVLIPVQVPVNARRPVPAYNEDNEEEIHLLGIYQLTQIWQRHKYIPPEEKRFQSTSLKKRDQNPLNIQYQTNDPSVVVTAELERLLLEDPGLDNPPAQLLPDSELYQKSTVVLSSLAQAIQAEKGVKMMDRRWHWRLHYNCFVGMELTTWLVQNFRDIDNRDEAIEFGNELMKHGLFHHVQRRHNFRDGNYFYQIADEYRVPRPESRGGWFQPRKVDKSTPNTPMAGEGVKDSPSSFRAKSDQDIDESGTNGQTPIPPKPTRNKVAIWLSKSMKYDVDPRKRSNRPEVIDLHYDRLHNPENCFHIELSWLNATPKLVEDAIVSWAGVAEKYGLKLVELPISEVSSIGESQVFRRPYPIKLKVDPPDPPSSTILTSSSFNSHSQPDRYYYHRAILKKFDFVLDFEPSSSFPSDVQVSHSWGKPDYRFPQYVHRTGAVLAQITDKGHFLLLANRLFTMRSPSTALKDSSKFDRNEYFRPRAATIGDSPLLERSSPRLSPIVLTSVPGPTPSNQSTPAPLQPPQSESLNVYRLVDELKDELREFCNDKEKLIKFYTDLPSQMRPVSTKMSPTVPMTLDSSIPSLELPASVVRHIQPTVPEEPAQRPPPPAPGSSSSSLDARMHHLIRYSPKYDPSRTPRP